jgi:replication factor C subunit 2/4
MNPFKILGKQITHQSTTWYMKYQPSKLNEIVGNDQAIKNLESYLAHNNIPHLLLTGPNGSGKATAIKCFVNTYFASITSTVLRKEAYLEINGAIDRGKDVVSEKNDPGKKSDKLAGMPNIISFIKKRVNLPHGLCKLVIIYDFDHMTSEAQMALRRIMEKYESTRFILQGNDGSVIEAIQSRCTPLRFSRLSDAEIQIVLKSIAHRENMHFRPERKSAILSDEPERKSAILSDEPERKSAILSDGTVDEELDKVIKLIALCANGDLKKAIGYLQVIGCSSAPSVSTYYKIFNIPSLENINSYLNFTKQSNLGLANQTLNKLLINGYNSDDVLDILLKVIVRREDLEYQTLYIQAVSETFLLNENCNSNTHLYALTSKLVNISRTGKYELDYLN